MSDSNDTKQRLRLRELSKYYCAASPSGLDVLYNQTDSRKDENGNFVLVPPRLALDGTLTALAQLAALRLGTQRSIISIIDDHAQHILAEATQSISPFDLDDHEPGDGLVLGMQSLPIKSCICSIGLDAFVVESTLELESPGSTADRNSIVIPDLMAEPRTRDIDIVKTLPQILRYYVEVPLRNEAGYVLGSICVMDSAVRRPGPKDIAHLQQVSKLVMQHLEWSRMKEDHRRAERSLEGLSHFIQGKDSISEWSKSTSGQTDIPSVYSEVAPLSSSRLLDARTIGSTSGVPVPSVEALDLVSTSSATTKRSSTNLLKSLEDACTTSTPPTSGPMKSSVMVPSTVGTDIETGSDPLSGQISNDEAQASTLTSLSIRQAFSRAANLIRESMDLDATCFLEVPQNERYKNPKKRTTDTSGQTTSETESMTDSSADSTPNDTPKDGSSPRDKEASPTNVVLCHRLGFSTRTKSSLAGSTTLQPYLTVPASLLTQLTNKYGEGHIFHFDSSGAISSGDDRDAKPQSRKGARTKMSFRLFRLFPTARSLIFLPLFDNDKQHVYAGFLGWTTDPTRALQKNEIIYVSGFANSIMCEIMRLQAVATDKAKSNFISSISHELRSPLHGILAAAQLLSESKSSNTQEEFVEMIDTCARTLLDIMNHLLDHAKINHFAGTKPRTRPSMKGKQRTESITYSLVTSVDLLSVIEETSMSMAASSNPMRQRDRQQITGITTLGDTTYEQGASKALSIPIILNIAPNKVWNFNSEAGSWRRIVMNLIGNSLKYTQQGHISVTLSFRDHAKSSKKCIAELKVTDTGQGISEEYLKHRLYTPFAQENNLSVGAGLGLSLVNQIVSSLRGNIQIHSEVGTGTEISISIPLEISEDLTENRIPAEVYDEELLELAKERTFEFRGFANWPSIHEPPTGIPDPRAKALLTMSESISGLLREWYKLKAASAQADIIVIEENFLKGNLKQYDDSRNNLLVVGIDGRNNTTDKIQHANFQYLLPPVGPKRMAHILKRLLKAREAMSKQSETRTHTLATQPKSIDRPDGSDVDPTKAISLDSHKSRRSSLSSARDGSERARRPKMPPVTPSLNTVPLRRKPTNLPASASGSSELGIAPTTSRKEAVLFVDDNDINLRILVACVTKIKASDIGYITASDGQQALNRYIEARNSGTRISVVFMDITMPVMDGFTSTRSIRAFEKEKGIRGADASMIVALTGLASAEAQHEVESCGFDLYLRKPVNLDTVREIMAKAREQAQRLDE